MQRELILHNYETYLPAFKQIRNVIATYDGPMTKPMVGALCTLRLHSLRALHLQQLSLGVCYCQCSPTPATP